MSSKQHIAHNRLFTTLVVLGAGAVIYVLSSGYVASQVGQVTEIPPNCGDAIVQEDEGEECDMGVRNKTSSICSETCKAPRCGDGKVQVALEECEPQKNPDGSYQVLECSGKLYCQPPLCTGTGANMTCVEGCYWRFLPKCVDPNAPVSSASSKSSMSSGTGSSVSSAASTSSVSLEDIFGPLIGEERQSSSAAVASASSFASAMSAQSSSIAPQILSGGVLPVTVPQFDPFPESATGGTSIETGSGLIVATPEVVEPICGNGTIEGGEQCDDGINNSDTTSGSCRIGCTLPFCGDGVLDVGEECDDGNSIEGDSCASSCTLSLCGNGVLEPGEECDDGTRNSDVTADSCSTSCMIPACGNGRVDVYFGELCDTGELNSNQLPDRCRLNCVPQRCGDRVVDTGEECDDGNSIDSDLCSNTCIAKSVCGDGQITKEETCDDGNTVAGDGCSEECVIEPPTVWKKIINWLKSWFD